MTRKLLFTVAIASLFAAACTKTVVLREDNPVNITAAPPAPPPPEPEPPPRVEIKEERIEVNDTIQFEYNKAVIRDESTDLMNEIASVIKKHPEIKKIRLEGHTDNVGSKKFNMDLSLRRAKAVREWLVTKGGLEASRFEVAGFGFDKPIAPNDTEEGRAKNRRVAFEIVERAPGKEGGATAEDGGAKTEKEGEDAGDEAVADDDKGDE